MKTRNQVSSLILPLIAVLLFSACSIIKPVEILEISNFKVADDKSRGISINASLKLFNPNRVNLTLNHSDIDVYAEGIYLGKVLIPEKTIIPGKQSFDVHFSLAISLPNLLTAGRQVINKFKTGAFDLSFKGKLNVSYRSFTKEFIVDSSQTVKLK
jgi:LEA14-like dessication related protein